MKTDSAMKTDRLLLCVVAGMILLVTACSHYEVYDPAGSKEHRAIK